METVTKLLDAVALCLFAVAAHRLFPRIDRLLALEENGALGRVSRTLRKLLDG